MNVTEKIKKQILSNLKPKFDRKIGLEYEAIFYNNHNKRIPANSETEISSEQITAELEEAQKNDEIKSGYTLEPGGQIEWASPPLTALHQIERYLELHRSRLQKIVDREGLHWIDYSLEPKYLPSDIPLINNKKYQLMDKMFKRTGSLGSWMMRNTTSVQINIDYSSLEEAEKMAFVADCITPIASMLFANSPYWKDRPAGDANLRYKIWSETDIDRCGDLLDHGIGTEKDLIHSYAEYVQTVPAIFILDEKEKEVEYKGTLGEWFKKLDDENLLTEKEIQIGLHQIFTHNRFKNVLEIRSCDKPSRGLELAPAAFWVGLLLNDESLDEIFAITKEWSFAERNKLKESAFILDLQKAGPKNQSIEKWVTRILDISLTGLSNRSKQLGINDESQYLTDYIDYFKSNGIPAIFAQNLEK